MSKSSKGTKVDFLTPTAPGDIKLGMDVIDRASLFTGIATATSELMSGSLQITITGYVSGISKGELLTVDWQQVGIIGPGMSAERIDPDLTIPNIVGKRAEDTASGLQGTIISRVVFFNGCTYFELQPRIDPSRPHLFPDSTLFPVIRIKVLDEAPESPPVKKAAKPPGGPSRTLPRRA